MRQYKQTILHDPPDSIGNCFQCCIASILNLELEAVPHFMLSDSWFEDFKKWLSENNLFTIEFVHEDIGGLSLIFSEPTYCIITGPSNRGCLHSIIGKYDDYGFEFIFDPHPSNEFVNEIEFVMFIGRKV